MKKKLGQNIWEFLEPFVDRLEKNLLMRLLDALTPLGILLTIIALLIGVLAFLRESEIRKHNLINLAFARLESAKGIKVISANWKL